MVAQKKLCARDNIVGIATRYGLEGPGLRSSGGVVWSAHPDRSRSPLSLLYIRLRLLFPGVEQPWRCPSHRLFLRSRSSVG